MARAPLVGPTSSVSLCVCSRSDGTLHDGVGSFLAARGALFRGDERAKGGRAKHPESNGEIGDVHFRPMAALSGSEEVVSQAPAGISSC